MSPAGKDESPCRKTPARPQEAALRCPRCDSPNTKFCYYNNYSLTQPRHFCKTCRRYWTKGGALRSVPIGGGCRKNKKARPSPPLSGDSSSGLKFFQGVAPAMDFQLNFSPINHFSSGLGDSSNMDLSAANSPLLGFDLTPQNQELGFRSSLASSMESLSCINQDLHWKLQKQRLAMLLPGDNSARPQPILFQDLEIPSSKQDSPGLKAPRKDAGGAVANLSTEWFFDSSNYAAAATSNGVINGDNGTGWGTGIQAWSDLSHYSSIP